VKNFQLVEPSSDGQRPGHLLNYDSKGRWHRACNRRERCIVAIRSMETDRLHLDCAKCNEIFNSWLRCEAAAERIKDTE
jgi:hypothetical protein